MSTEYELRPQQTFDQVIDNMPSDIFPDFPENSKYITRHVLLTKKGLGTAWLFEWEGFARFELFVGQPVQLLKEIAKELNCKLFTEYEEEIV